MNQKRACGRVFALLEGNLLSLQHAELADSISESRGEPMEKAILRNRSIGTKVSEEEYAQLEKRAGWRRASPALRLTSSYRT